MTASKNNNLEPFSRPQDILSSWYALEVLSPQTFMKPEDFCTENSQTISTLDYNGLPWENPKNKPSMDKDVFYHILLGSLNMAFINKDLTFAFGDELEEKFPTKQRAAIAFVTVDASGCIKGAENIAISSFAWGYPQALKGKLKNLDDWSYIESKLRSEIFSAFFDLKDRERTPITKDQIIWFMEQFRDKLGIAESHIEKSVYFIHKFIPTTKVFKVVNDLTDEEGSKEATYPDPPLLNSFYLADLANAKTLFVDKEHLLGKSLITYLGATERVEKVDILEGTKNLQALLTLAKEKSKKNKIPNAKTPLGRWPSPNRHSLILLQQAAVNAAMHELSTSGVLGINGPPGTGKTILLRDMVAAIIIDRAQAMVNFADPENAFSHKGKFPVGQSYIHLYEIDKTLKGFEMIVASSNNKAVENITKELPLQDSVNDELEGLRYFKTTSDKLHEKVGPTWGLIAAAMGNGANQKAFRDVFWDKDVGLQNYLKAAIGQDASIEDKCKQTGKINKRAPQIVLNENPPIDKADALKRWKEATQKFNKKLEDIKCLYAVIENGTLQKKTTNPNADLHTAKELAGLNFADKNFWLRQRGELHKSTAWLSPGIQACRDDVFIAAMDVHKAFIDAAAKPIRHNLMAHSHVTKGASISPELQNYITSIWATFHMVVPVVSTTFASVSKMLNHIPTDSIGWLFVDEAGQAAPQAAVGAIMRSKRVVMVGDPLQIEPVVSQSEKLIRSVCAEFSVNPDLWAAPIVSAQSCADRISRYGTWMGEDKDLWVGFPLLVHRRCDNPMFTISNKVAYGNLMIHAANQPPSLIRDVLGESRWIDLRGRAQDKWCAEEGELMITMLKKLVYSGIDAPDMYIITPFRDVAYKMRVRLNQEKALFQRMNQDIYPWLRDRIGTIHTFQGKEAEAVFMILGAQDPNQHGARSWAGSKPNLLNVAATRAKNAFYVIGNHELWSKCGTFNVLQQTLPVETNSYPKSLVA
jgi:hypothetical protein